METLPKALAEEIESLEELDARALKRKYPALLSDAGECSASGILRSIVAVGGAERTVNDEEIAFADARSYHRIALDAHEVRGGRTLHQKFVQVKRWLQIVQLATETPRSTSRSLRALVSLAAPSEAELLRCIPTEPDTFAFADMVVQKLIAVYFTILASVGR